MAEKSGEDPDAAAREVFVIREIYESPRAEEFFESELERALEARVRVIIIEPTKLGDETARWIHVGNCLHKTAVLSGLCCLAAGANWPDEGLYFAPCGFLSVLCSSIYAASWQFDPCCKYQVEYNTQNLQKIPLQNLNSTSPIILVRRNDTRRKVLHNTLSLLSLGFCSWRIYECFFKG